MNSRLALLMMAACSKEASDAPPVHLTPPVVSSTSAELVEPEDPILAQIKLNRASYDADSGNSLKCAEHAMNRISTQTLQSKSKRAEDGDASYKSETTCEGLRVTTDFQFECSPEDVPGERSLGLIVETPKGVASYQVVYQPGSDMSARSFDIGWQGAQVAHFYKFSLPNPYMFNPTDTVPRSETTIEGEFTDLEKDLGGRIYKVLHEVKFPRCVN